jgi:hypothetical protein
MRELLHDVYKKLIHLRHKKSTAIKEEVEVAAVGAGAVT